MTYYEKNKHVRLNYQKAYYRENTEEIKKYTKAYYELNKIQMKEKRKGNLLMKRKPKENEMLSVIYTDVTIRFD
jgi:hypothetical protein